MLAPSQFWSPLPSAEFNREAAAHLLKRATWTATPAEVEKAVSEGLDATLKRLFPGQPSVLPASPLLAELESEWPELAQKIASADPQERRRLQPKLRERSQSIARQIALDWLDAARQPGNAAAEKWHLFLGDVYVVSLKKVKNVLLWHRHRELLRQNAWTSAPVLTKAVTRSPAMVVYLDLQESERETPNENFSRELFELFVLGQGNYTEQDIKEAARAFTGYRQRAGEFRFVKRLHDSSPKTVFGASGRWTGDDVVDLAYRQPGAATFLPEEMVRFYLSAAPIPSDHLSVIGALWKNTGFNLHALVRLFFSSRGFYSPEFRGTLIKSPVQFYLGMVSDLDLEVLPVPRPVLGALRLMGQELTDPPNVRGWVGGRQWINSATLAARQRAVQTHFQPLQERQLNADDQRELERARARGRREFRLDPTTFRIDESPQALLARLLCPASAEAYRPVIEAELRRPLEGLSASRLMASLLQSPGYQLC